MAEHGYSAATHCFLHKPVHCTFTSSPQAASVNTFLWVTSLSHCEDINFDVQVLMTNPLQVWYSDKNLHSSANIFFFSIPFAWRKIRNATKTCFIILYSSNKGAVSFRVIQGTGSRSKCSLINLFWLTVKRHTLTQEKVRSMEEKSSQECSSTAEEWEAGKMFFFSLVRPCRQRPKLK